MTTSLQPRGSFIDGAWVQSKTSSTRELVNPATEEVVAEVTDADRGDVDLAVTAAKRALRGWAATSLHERVEIMLAAADGMAQRANYLALAQTTQMGAPIVASRRSIAIAGNLLRTCVDDVRRMAFEILRRDDWGQSLVRREPVGVVGAIAPWNGPLPVAVNKLVPALLVGCTAVIKPAPETPLETLAFAEICAEAGLPAGVLNVVTGGTETGEAIVDHPDVAKVTFTGSSAAGRRIAQACARRGARFSLELGGKSAAIILDDADFDAIVPIVATANFSNSGQACIALSRVLVPRRRHDEFVEAAVEAASAYVVGDPMDESTTLGPLVAERQRARVLGYLEGAAAQGARAAVGGGRPAHLDRGYFVEPTVLVSVEGHMTVAREEVFGPVMSVLTYDNVDDAVELANDTSYGLHGGIFTSDLARGLEVAKRVVTGTITINAYGTHPSAPFGGVKDSGVGREHGPEGIATFCELKTYVIPKDLYQTLAASGLPEG